MSKYIPAEKLIAEIERFSATEYGGNTFGDDVANGALDYVLEEIIPSLQQEQPEADLDGEIKKMLNSDYYKQHIKPSPFVIDVIKYTARHFYELGLNARKEESL